MRPARWNPLLQAGPLLLLAVLGACAGKATRDEYREPESSPDLRGKEVLAQVNGEAITRAEFDSFVHRSTLERSAAELQHKMEKDPEVRRDFLQELVLRRLLLQWSKRLEITVSEAEIDEAARRGVDPSEKVLILTSLFEDGAKTGSRAEFRQSVQEELVEAKVFLRLSQEGALKDDPVTESAVRAFYDANQDQYKGSYAEERDRIELLLRIEKRRTDHRKTAMFLFRRSEIIPADLTMFHRP